MDRIYIENTINRKTINEKNEKKVRMDLNDFWEWFEFESF